MWLLGLMVHTAAAIECTEPVQQSAMVTAMDEAEQAYANLDEDGFRDGVNEIAGLMLPCIGEALDPTVTARYHRLMALRLHEIGDEDNASGSVLAARTVAPDAPFDEALVPSNHALRSLWEASPPDEETKKVPEPRYGSLAFDGEIGRDRPKNRPTVAQVFDDTGVAQTTLYLGAREPLPSYAAVPRRRNMLIGCAAGAGVGAGVTYGLSWSNRSRMFNQAAIQDTSDVDLDGLLVSTNVMSLLSTSLVAVTAGCGTGAVLVGER